MDTSRLTGNSFLREMKRRKVIRTCFLYVLLCWGALQVGDVLFPALALDGDDASRTFLYFSVAGFPLVFAIAWFFQITTQGIVRTTSFVERRVLSNVAPVNERRRGNMATYFRKGDEHPDFRWMISAETGPLAGLSFGVVGPLVLGRSLDCDIAMVTPHVSRRHACLDIEDGKLVVEDLGSANGTVLNGRPLKARHVLRNEDELRFHDIIFRVTEQYSGPRSESDAKNQTTFIDSSDMPPSP